MHIMTGSCRHCGLKLFEERKERLAKWQTADG